MTTRVFTGLLLGTFICSVLLSIPRAGAKQDWVEVRSPNFIVVSNAGEKEARKMAVHFEQIRGVFRRSIRVASEHPSPVITVLAVKDESTMKQLLPEYWAKGHAHPAGIFFYSNYQYFAAVQLNAEGANPYHTIFHEYYHSLTLPYYPNLPLWVAEGLADFWGNTEISGSEVQMGRPDASLVYELRQSKLIPLDVLFKVDHSSPYYNEQEKTSIFYAESWALTHYLMIGDKAIHRPMLAAYLDAISQGLTADQAAAKAFGNLKKLQDALEAYVRGGSFYILKGGAPPTVPDSDLHARELSDAEFGAYRGGFEAVRGAPKDAIPILEEAVKADPKLALGYQYLGYAELENRQPKEALADLSRAIELDPNNAITRFLRARLNSNRNGEERSAIEADLRAAIAANPDFAPAYAMLGIFLVRGGEHLPEALTLAQQATRLQPGNAEYQFDMAEVLLVMHRLADARKMAEAASKGASNPVQRAAAESLLKTLDEEAAGPGTVATPAPATAASGGKQRMAVGANHNSQTTSSVEGNVKQVSCTGNEMILTLNADEGLFTLHARDATRVPYEKDVAFDNGEFQACTQLEGHQAKITFTTASDQKYDGEIQAVEVLK